MFGTYRFLLAQMVVVAHLAYGVGMWSGVYAVFSFFALSGFLMTMVLEITYPATAKGVGRYLANRALRIYPPYLLVLLLALGMVLINDYWAGWIGNTHMPRDPVEWLRNLAIFSLHLEPKETARLVPPSWSVDIELCFYVIMGLGLARSRVVVLVWLGASLAWTVWANLNGLPFTERYMSILPASLPYAVGAALWMHRESLQRWIRGPIHAIAAPAAYFIHMAAANHIWAGDPFGMGFYVSLGLTAWVIVALSGVSPERFHPRVQTLDTFLGNLSYPVFLCHFAVASGIAMAGISLVKGPRLFWWSLPFIIGVAWLVHLTSETPLVWVRDRVRGRRRPSAVIGANASS